MSRCRFTTQTATWCCLTVCPLFSFCTLLSNGAVLSADQVSVIYDEFDELMLDLLEQDVDITKNAGCVIRTCLFALHFLH